MPNELPIPAEALQNRSVEIIRVWLANQKQHVVLNIGFWEDRGLNERHAWGILIADMLHHIANAHHSEYGHDPVETVALIRQAFEAELDSPTSERLGQFMKVRREDAERGAASDPELM